jgi:D-tyrosyl-tRNA(Tyr) deacylase
MKLLFLVCEDPSIDPVAPGVFQCVKALYPLLPTSLKIGGRVVSQANVNGHCCCFAQTRHVASAVYPEIANDIREQFSDFDMIGVINWHGGANAPSKIFCVHSVADVVSGTFGVTSGEKISAVLSAIESERKSAGLDTFTTLFEASHWSGTVYGRTPAELLNILVPVFDIEIGSSLDDWGDVSAHQVLARALGKIPEFCGKNAFRALYLGGTHFEQSATELVFQGEIALEHHLPNHWLLAGEYNIPGAEQKIIAAANSCLQTPELIIYHAGLKSPYKECAKKAASLMQVPCASHRQLRDPDWKQKVFENQY